MITRPEAHGDRRCPSLVVDLDWYRTPLGTDGAGKSTYLDPPMLIDDMRQQQVVAAILERRQEDRATRAIILMEQPHKGRGDFIVLAFKERIPPNITEALEDADFRNLAALTSMSQCQDLAFNALRA